jgi:hypothetical protein
MLDNIVNPTTGNHYWFDYMLNHRWTIKAIRNTFTGNRAIAEHIQSTARNEKDAWAIADAANALINQVGF